MSTTPATPVMRAKLQVGFVQQHFGTDKVKTQETLTMHAVARSSAYPADGSDEDNTFAKFSPGANLVINIANPALFDKFAIGDRFYVDFTKVEPA